MRELGDLPVRQLQYVNVAIVATLPVRNKGHALPIRRNYGVAVVVRSECELPGGAAGNRQLKKVPQEIKDNRTAVGSHGNPGLRHLAGIELQRARPENAKMPQNQNPG